MTPEAKVIKSLSTYVRKLRAAGEPIKMVKLHGSQFSKAGTPDLHITYRGRSIWVEAKRDDGKATKLQEHELDQWGKAGAIVGVVRTVEELQELLARVE